MKSGYDIIVRYPIQRRNCDIQYKDVTVACTTEMPLPIETVKAQLKVWEYKCVLIVGNPHWPYAYKTTETYTYEYAMLTPSPHKMKLVLTHHVDAHPIPYLHVEVATADKKSSYQKPDIMNKPILIGSLLELYRISYTISYAISYSISV